MNEKLLKAQLARHGKADWAESDQAYDRIDSLTRLYNTPKWNHIMDFRPRRLPVFDRIKRDSVKTELPQLRKAFAKWNGADCTSGSPTRCEGLGYEEKAVAVAKGQTIEFTCSAIEAEEVEIEVRLLPNHPIEEQLRFTLALDGHSTDPIAYETRGRSEEWKVNVLTNQAVRRVTLPITSQKHHRLTFTAVDEGVVLDQIYEGHYANVVSPEHHIILIRIVNPGNHHIVSLESRVVDVLEYTGNCICLIVKIQASAYYGTVFGKFVCK